MFAAIYVDTPLHGVERVITSFPCSAISPQRSLSPQYDSSTADDDDITYAVVISFSPGEQVLVLMPDKSSSHLFSRWSGPASVIRARSTYSYTVELDDVERYFHANKLRKFYTKVDSVMCNSLNENLDSFRVNMCAIIHESDDDFGEMLTIPESTERTNLMLPSEQIDLTTIVHLTVEQQAELLQLLDK